MGIRDTLKLAKQAMNPEAIKQGLSTGMTPPTEEELQATLEALPPEKRAEVEANLAAGRAAEQEAFAMDEARRVLDGPAGDFLYGPSAAEQMAALQTGGIKGSLAMTAKQFGKEMKGVYGGDMAKHEKDRNLAGQIGAQERAARDAARAPYLAPDRWPVHISRVATRGATQVDEVIAFLRSSGLGARPDLVYGVYRVPDRISPAITPSSERGRLVEWDIVHGGLPEAPVEVPVVAAANSPHAAAPRRTSLPSMLPPDCVAAIVWSAPAAVSAGFPPCSANIAVALASTSSPVITAASSRDWRRSRTSAPKATTKAKGISSPTKMTVMAASTAQPWRVSPTMTPNV